MEIIAVYWCRCNFLMLLLKVGTLSSHWSFRKKTLDVINTPALDWIIELFWYFERHSNQLQFANYTRVDGKSHSLCSREFLGITNCNILDALMPFSSLSRNNQFSFNDVFQWNLAIDNRRFSFINDARQNKENKENLVSLVICVAPSLSIISP